MSKKEKPELSGLDEDSLNDIFKDLDGVELDGIDLEDDFLGNDFLDENFLKEFDLDSDEKQEKAGDEDILSLFSDADSIFSGVKEQMDSADTKNSNDAALEAFFGASESTETVKAKEEPISMGDFSIESLFADGSDGGQDEAPQEDEDVLKILEGLEGIDLELEEESVSTEKSEDMNNAALEDFMGQGAASSEERHEKKEKKPKKEKKKSGNKNRFLNKLSVILFGEDEDEEEEKGKKTIIDFDDSMDVESIDISGEDAQNLMLFGENSSGEAKKDEETDKKGKKKKEKKKKEKKEKPKKEKKPRPKKEKKPKPPKEPDNSPPLPKKPVILMFLMTASLVALILMGSNLLGYSNQMNNAKNLYAKQNYSEAFAEISGIEVKEDDLELYEKYHIMAMVATELEAYESLMNAGYYDMAIDCLVRTIGRAEKYRVDAGIYGCVQEMDSLAQEAEAVLSQMFGISREKALELYASKTKEEYSYAIKKIVRELGLEKVSE